MHGSRTMAQSFGNTLFRVIGDAPTHVDFVQHIEQIRRDVSSIGKVN